MGTMPQNTLGEALAQAAALPPQYGKPQRPSPGGLVSKLSLLGLLRQSSR